MSREPQTWEEGPTLRPVEPSVQTGGPGGRRPKPLSCNCLFPVLGCGCLVVGLVLWFLWAIIARLLGF
jgi:hypothetical protein